MPPPPLRRREGRSERASPVRPPPGSRPSPFPSPPPSPPLRPLGRAAVRRELQEAEEAEEGAREGGSARPPAAGAAAAAGAASRPGAAEHGAGAAVDTAGIPEAGDALRAPRWKKCWLFGDEKWQKLTLYWYTSTIRLCCMGSQSLLIMLGSHRAHWRTLI